MFPLIGHIKHRQPTDMPQPYEIPPCHYSQGSTTQGWVSSVVNVGGDPQQPPPIGFGETKTVVPQHPPAMPTAPQDDSVGLAGPSAPNLSRYFGSLLAFLIVTNGFRPAFLQGINRFVSYKRGVG